MSQEEVELIVLGILLGNSRLFARERERDLFISLRVREFWDALKAGKDEACKTFSSKGLLIGPDGEICKAFVDEAEVRRLRHDAENVADVLKGAIDTMDAEQLKAWLKSCNEVATKGAKP
jgi:hypothetical protein